MAGQVDLDPLRNAILSVIEAAKAEAAEFHAASLDCGEDTLQALYQAHLAELDAVQTLIARLQLFEKRLRGS